MQVSTKLFYDRSATAMGTLAGRADTLQTQIATGKRLAAPSDDSVAYARLSGLARTQADAEVTLGNLGIAAGVLAQADSTLSDIAAQLTRAGELALTARNGTQDATSRKAIADELDQIVAQLVGLGNATDTRGQPLFGGVDGGAAVTASAGGGYSFATTLPGAIPTGDGQSIQPGDTAARIFQQADGNTLATIEQLSAALRSGTAVDATAATTIDRLTAATTQVTGVQVSLGARAARVELEQAALKDANTDREALRSGLEDTDVTVAITELQKTMTILSATQASFTKLQSLSLFDYLR
jgi:flagellar hook-associated protein 3 FlgL